MISNESENRAPTFRVAHVPAASCLEFAAVINKIVSFEIKKGVRSNVHDPHNQDSLDRLQREFILGSQQTNSKPILISKLDIYNIRGHHLRYAVESGMPDDGIESDLEIISKLNALLGEKPLSAPQALQVQEKDRSQRIWSRIVRSRSK